MNLKELREIIQQVVENDISEFEYEKAGTRVRIKRGSHDSHGYALTVPGQQGLPMPNPQAYLPSYATEAPAPSEALEKKLPPAEDLHSIRSPIVGTFYRSPSPGAPPFVKIGDQVEVGTVLCLIEAMKLMNEIESDVAGEVVKVVVENNQPVEYGQLLFVLGPR